MITILPLFHITLVLKKQCKISM